MSESDPQRRPRPAYGEYATPEEQRAAIKQPADWQLEGLAAGTDSTQAAPQQPLPGAYRPGGPQHPGQRPQGPPPQGNLHWPQEESRPPQQPVRANFGDRFVTFVLLGFGLSNVIGVVADAFNGGRAMRESMAVMGGSYEHLADALPAWLWQGQAIIYAVVWLVTLIVSLSSMRAGRRSWWVPVVGAFVAFILFFAIFVIALGENPDLLNILPSPSPGQTGTPS
jgi:hypothetical protein